MNSRSPDVYLRMLDELHQQKAALQQREEELTAQIRPTLPSEPQENGTALANILRSVEEVLTAPAEDFSPAEKQSVLAILIDKILPDDEGIHMELKMGTRYKVTVTFQGVGALDIEAASPEAARLAVKELTVADMARASRTDILAFQVSAREIVPIGEHEEETDEKALKPRPSGWYRPA